MTNEEILKAMHERGAAGYGTAMELARQDEREKMQGVDVFVSWDSADKVISTEKPETYEQDGKAYYCNYGYVIECNVKDFATHLGVSEGQWKKFRIVEINETNQLTTEAT